MSLPSSPEKRERGQFFTQGNPFVLAPFRSWFSRIPHAGQTPLLEPFGGANHIIELMRQAGFDNPWQSFDIDPPAPIAQGVPVQRQDTLVQFPKGFEVVITNPPYLARNSAQRRKISYPETKFDDIYKHALDVMLKNVGYVAAIIPESFVVSGEFRDRLSHSISLTSKMFEDTECPVCLALFVPSAVKPNPQDFELWDEGQLLGRYEEFAKVLAPAPEGNRIKWKFNDPNGEIGLRGVDNHKHPSIRFVRGSEIDPALIKHSSRAVTRISGLSAGMDLDALIQCANAALDDYRLRTHDTLMTPFKGLRQDGRYRRRLDFAAARHLLDKCVKKLEAVRV
jgi:hypothetical protein